MELHFYKDRERKNQFVCEVDTGYCCNPMIKSIENKTFRIAMGGVHLMEDGIQTRFIKFCPFCASPIIKTHHVVSTKKYIRKNAENMENVIHYMM